MRRRLREAMQATLTFPHRRSGQSERPALAEGAASGKGGLMHHHVLRTAGIVLALLGVGAVTSFMAALRGLGGRPPEDWVA